MRKPSSGKQAAPGVTFTPEPSRLSPHSRQLYGFSASDYGEMGEMGEQGEQGELPTWEGEHRRERLGEGLRNRIEEEARRRPLVAGALGAAASGEVRGRVPLNKRTK